MTRPVVWGAAVWTCGYALACALPGARAPWWVAAAGVCLLACCFAFPFRGSRVVALASLLCAAYGYYDAFDGRNVTSVPASRVTDGSAVRVSGTIVTPVTVDGDRVSFAADIRELDAAESTLRLKERVQVSIRLLAREEQLTAASWRRGDAVELGGKLQSPSPARNFGAFDYRRYLRLQHIHWLVTAKGIDDVQVRPPTRWSEARLLGYVDRLRDWLGDKADSLFPGTQAGYMKGLLLGIREDLDPGQFRQFSRLGLTHILAISGLHVAVFVGCIVWIMRRLGMTRESYLLTAICMLPFYILLTGAAPSVIRAGLMAMIALYAARKGQLRDGLHLVCAVGWGMLLWNPYYLLDVGFQLSFLVTIGLIVFVPRVNKLLPVRLYPMVRSALAVTIVSQLVSFPLSIYYFNQFSAISWLANMALVPLISLVVTPAGSAALIASAVSEQAGMLLTWPVVALNKLTFWTVGAMERWESFHMIWPSPSLWWIAAYYALLAAIVCALDNRSRFARQSAAATDGGETGEIGILPYADDSTPWAAWRRSRTAVACCAALLAALLVYAYAPSFMQRTGAVQFLDVGQGDSILIRTPGGRTILVDGGGTLSFRKPGEEWKQRSNEYEVGNKLLVPLLKKRGVHRLDYVIATHEDADHIGGLQAVIEQMPVSRLLYNGTLKPGQTAEKLFRTALDRGIPLHSLHAGTDIAVDGRTRIHVLFPVQDEGAPVITAADKQNGESIVFILAMDGVNMLFTGDMEQAAEADVLARLADTGIPDQLAGEGQAGATRVPTAIDVLKVAHHGSKTSTGDDWLRYWQPRVAVISVGANNSYGHPSPVVMQRLADHHIPVFRTDERGEVQMVVRDGQLLQRSKLPAP